jgi:hypothetical protein
LTLTWPQLWASFALSPGPGPGSAAANCT